MHGGANFDLYKKWLVSEHPLPQQVNCGYYAPQTLNYRTTPRHPLKSKSMITKPVSESSISNGSTFVSHSSTERMRSKPHHEQTIVQRPKTAKDKTKPVSPAPRATTAKARPELVSSSETETKRSARIESTDLIKNIKEVSQ